MSFVQRQITVTFSLGQGSFGNSGQNTVKLSGLRISAKIVKAGGPSMSTLQMQVYGMQLSQMNQLSTLGMQLILYRRNTVVVEAGDVDSGMATVFVGTITNAWADMQSAPDVPFRVEAHTGLLESVQTVPPSSYTGPTNVSVVMSSLATKMGLAFENNGISIILSNPYFYGSPRNQAKAAAQAAGIEWIIDNGKLAIWPKGQARGGSIPLISPDTGMRGYPMYTSKGVQVVTLFNPSIGYGGKINVQSSLTPACGEWVVCGLDYDLDAQVPHGKWFTSINAVRPGLGPVIQ